MSMERKESNLAKIMLKLTDSLNEAKAYMDDPENIGEVKSLKKSLGGYQLEETISSMLGVLDKKVFTLMDFFENDALYNESILQLDLMKSNLYDEVVSLITNDNHGDSLEIPTVCITGKRLPNGFVVSTAANTVSVDNDRNIIVWDSDSPDEMYEVRKKDNDIWSLLILYKLVKVEIMMRKGGEDGHERA